jgi:hypothetical protein
VSHNPATLSLRRLFGEDVQLLVDLRRLVRCRGQHLARLRGVKAVASTRKFDSHGDWHYLTQLMRLVPLMLFRPAASHEFAQRHRCGDHRPPEKPSLERSNVAR